MVRCKDKPRFQTSLHLVIKLADRTRLVKTVDTDGGRQRTELAFVRDNVEKTVDVVGTHTRWRWYGGNCIPWYSGYCTEHSGFPLHEVRIVAQRKTMDGLALWLDTG